MTENFPWRIFYVLSALFLAAGLVIALILGEPATILGGMVFGTILGIVPFASWHLVLRLTLNWQNPSRRKWGVALSVGKWGVIIGTLYFALKKELVQPMAVIIGMSFVLGALVVLAFQRMLTPPNRLKELKPIEPTVESEAKELP